MVLREVAKVVPSHNPELVNSVRVPTNLITAVLLFELTTAAPFWVLHAADWESVSNLLKVSGSKTRTLLSLISTVSKEAIWPSVKALSVAESFSDVSFRVALPKAAWGATPIVGIINASEAFTDTAASQ